MRNIKVVFATVYYQTLISARLTTALIFSLVFPVFVFCFFGTIWGVENVEYIGFLLSGIIGLTIASDGMFSVGPVIKLYYANNLLKYFRTLPLNILSYYLGLFLSRVIRIFVSIILLSVVAALLFSYHVSADVLFLYLIGTFVGLLLFSLLGLVIAFYGRTHNSDQGILNLFYFANIFLSDTFYPVSDLNSVFHTVSLFVPLTYVLEYMRNGSITYLLVSLLWVSILAIIFYFTITRSSIKR